jgi:hypothetical protein
VLAWVAFRLRDEPRPLPPARELMRTPAALAPFPALVFLNGLCPYVGAKTETAFAMYSNLRTEGGSTNHLLVPRPLALFPYQTDLARVLSSSDTELQALAEAGHPVPFFTLRRRLAELARAGVGGVRLSYVRGGRTLTTEAAERDAELARPPSAFELRFLRVRTILPPDANACSH